MPKNLLEQLPLTPATIDHVHAKELAAMSDLLDQLPEAVALVHADLSWRGKRRVDPAKGRDGMAAEQVLRAGVLKQHTGSSYERLAFGLADSSTYRSFCRLGFDRKPPIKSTLQKKRQASQAGDVGGDLPVADQEGAGARRREGPNRLHGGRVEHPSSHRFVATGRLRARLHTAHEEGEREFWLAFQEPQAAGQAHVKCETILEIALVQAIAAEISHFIPLAQQVISQTERRVLRGESVPSDEKIVSIVEPHTSIIIKDNRGTEYGHKVCITTGASSLVTDVVVETGNPADATLAVKMIERQRDLFGKAPKQASFDGGFATRANLTAIKALGVQDAAFHKRRDIPVTEMTSSDRIFKKLRAFRAGIEGVISFLKRTFGLERCTWRGFASFKAYVHASVLACNLLVLARRVLAARA